MISSNHNVLPLVPKHPLAPEQDHPLEESRAALRPTSEQPPIARSVVAPDNTHHLELINALTSPGEQGKHKYYGTSQHLKSLQVRVGPDPFFARLHNLVPGQTISAERYLQALGWTLPRNWQETVQLTRKLANPLPEQPVKRDFWGFLTRPLPLTQTQQDQVRAVVREWAGSDQRSLLAQLGEDPITTDGTPTPRLQLEQLIAGPKGQDLGKKIEGAMDGASTTTSINDWLMTALVLELDPAAGKQRNHIAGYDLAQPDNWGKTPKQIMHSLHTHLLDTRNLPSDSAQAGVYAMLSRVAPEFLVQQLPDNLVYGSSEWAVFSAAVSRIEQQAPGTSATMTYDQVIEFGATAPSNDRQAAQATVANRNALVDWGVANGFLHKNDDDHYSLQAIEYTQAKFNQHFSEIKQNADAVALGLPTRRTLAEAELKKVLGSHVPLDKKFINLGHNNRGGSAFSIIDLYMSGRLNAGNIRSVSNRELLNQIKPKLGDLKNIEELFESRFEQSFNSIKSAYVTRLKHMISRLPLEDRKNIEFGGLTAYSIREAIYSPNKDDLQDKKHDNIGRQGLLIKTVRDDKVTYYEFFLGDQTLHKRTDLPDPLPIGARKISNGSDGFGYFETPHWLVLDQVKYGLSEYKVRPQSQVIVDETPLHTRRSNTDDPRGLSQTPRTFFTSKTELIAHTVTEHFFHKQSNFKAAAWGETEFENQDRKNSAINNTILNVIVPFKSAIENAIAGKWDEAAGDALLDIFGLLSPGTRASSTATRLNTGIATRLLKGAQRVGTTLIKNANPLDIVAELGKLAGKGLGKLTSVTSKGIHTLRATGYDLLKAGNGLDAISVGTFKYQDSVVEGTAVLKNQKWYPLDPVTQKPYGPPLEHFLPAAQASRNDLEKWEALTAPLSPEPQQTRKQWAELLERTQAGPGKAAFDNGYNSGSAENIPGYSAKMNSQEVLKLAVKPTLTPEQVGALARQRERLQIQQGLNGASKFSEDVSSVGGTVIPVPQVLYVSQTNPLADGHCAALSRVMADAIGEGKEMTLIGNIFEAAAKPATPASRKFIAELKDIQRKVITPAAFHGAKPVRQMGYVDIVQALSRSPTSKTLMISSPGHAMMAGVIRDGANTKFFFYDPNFGLALFSDAEMMNRGLGKVLNNKKLPTPYKTFSDQPDKLEFKVSEHDHSWSGTASVNHDPVKQLFAKSISSPPPVKTVKPASAQVAPEKVFVAEYDSVTVTNPGTQLFTRGISDCSAIVILSDLNEGIYCKRTLMHLRGSSLNDLQSKAIKEAQGSFADGSAKLILVGGDSARSPYGLGATLRQEHKGETLLADLVKKHPNSITITTASGVDVNPNGTFNLIEGNYPVKELSQREKLEVFDFVD